MRPEARRGTVLILVAGIAALLLSLAFAFLARVRVDAESAQLVVRDAQSRIMLSAAIHYVQETARLGWGGGDPALEAYGWTDVRDGEAGPRGPWRAGGPQRLGWTPGGGYPAPGGAMRGDAFCWDLPPYAVRSTTAPNPLVPTATLRDPATINAYIGLQPRDTNFDAHKPHWQELFDQATATGAGALDPQPVADTWTAYAEGRRRVRPESANLAWFRVYRERPEEHDGDGSPWYDTMPCAGHGVFIITVGSSATRGFRFWNSAGNDFLGGETRSAGFDRTLEPVTAEESGWFDETSFRLARASDRLQWFRIEWTAAAGGGLDVRDTYWRPPASGSIDYGRLLTGLLTQTARGNDRNFSPSYGGSIAWIQRLEKEPPRW